MPSHCLQSGGGYCETQIPGFGQGFKKILLSRLSVLLAFHVLHKKKAKSKVSCTNSRSTELCRDASTAITQYSASGSWTDIMTTMKWRNS